MLGLHYKYEPTKETVKYYTKWLYIYQPKYNMMKWPIPATKYICPMLIWTALECIKPSGEKEEYLEKFQFPKALKTW